MYGDIMKCNKCNKNITKGFIAFCEKCERYFCMNCLSQHKHHEFSFLKVKNGKISYRINTGISAAGIGMRYSKQYQDEEWVYRHQNCGHIRNTINKNQPIFYCIDGKIRCVDCFYNSNLDFADPMIKVENNKFLFLLTHNYEPHNLNFKFLCDNIGTKGKESKLTFSIENNKIHKIKDITVIIEAYAAKPVPQNESYYWYVEMINSNCILYEKFHFDSIRSNVTLKKELNIRIPNDFEIKKNTFFDTPRDTEKNEFEENGFLKVPNNLMIYAHFTYKTHSDFQYYSEVKNSIIKLI